MTRSRTPIDGLADEVVRTDVSAQQALPEWTKSSRARTAIPYAAQPAIGRNWLIIGLAGLILIALIGVGGGVLLLGAQPTPTAGAISPTQSPAGTSASPTGVGATASPTTAAVPSTTQAVPSATQPPATTTNPPTEPSGQPGTLADAAVRAAMAAISNATVALPDSPIVHPDEVGGVYLPHDGSPATADAPHIDLQAGAAFAVDLTPAQATALSSHPCAARSERDGVAWYTACNQSGPLPAGEYYVFVSQLAAPLPEPFPQQAQCVYLVQSDVDNDRATGFASQLPYNHLIGADVYFENLFFWDQAGDFRNYILATDHAMPIRPDTGEIHGNLPTRARWFGSAHMPGGDGASFQIAFLPSEPFGDNWSLGGFCNTDRSIVGPDAFAVDALGNPGNALFPDYWQFGSDLPG